MDTPSHETRHGRTLLRIGRYARLRWRRAALEANYMVPGVEKYHVEDLVIVTEQGPRVVSRAADWSRLLTA